MEMRFATLTGHQDSAGNDDGGRRRAAAEAGRYRCAKQHCRFRWRELMTMVLTRFSRSRRGERSRSAASRNNSWYNNSRHELFL